MKNLMATVQAVARQNFRGKGFDPSVRAFAERLKAMASAHNALLNDGWQSAPLSTIVDETIVTFLNQDGSNFAVEGPHLDLDPKAAMALSMSLHELCTNATKYGALSIPTGKVTILWWIEGADDAAIFNLTWTESGGPPVDAPTSTGFGSTLIKEILASQIRGTVIVDYAITGFICTVKASIRNVVLAVTPDDPGHATAVDPLEQ